MKSKLMNCKGPVIIYHLGGRKILGGSIVTESPKGAINKNFKRIQGGTTQICLDNARQGGGGGEGGSRKLLIVMRGDNKTV